MSNDEDPATVEAAKNTLQKHFNDLREAPIEPAALAAELLARRMISTEAEWESRQTSVNPANRRTSLVSLVTTLIGTKAPGAFENFIQALAKQPQNHHICERLIGEHNFAHTIVTTTYFVVTATYKTYPRAKDLSADSELTTRYCIFEQH